MLGRPVHAHDRDVHGIGPVGHRRRDRRAAQPDVAHQRPVLVREVGMVEQAREEERRARAAVHVVFEHRREHGRRIPHVDQVDRIAPEDGDEQRGEHADAVPDRCAGEGRDVPAGLHRAELADLEADGAVRVHDALRICRRAGGVRDERGRRRIDARGHVHRVAIGERREREQVGRDIVVGHRRRRARGRERRSGSCRGWRGSRGGRSGRRSTRTRAPDCAEDEPDFLHAVEVHDRHRHRAEERRRPERRRRLDPVRQLERDQVARADAPGAKPSGDAAGEIGDVAERARVRPERDGP